MKDLKPCPFCASGITDIDVTRLQPTMSGSGATISARIRHWCKTDESRRLQTFIDVGGRTEEETIRLWNTRAND